mgnify:CR=1 FL=1
MPLRKGDLQTPHRRGDTHVVACSCASVEGALSRRPKLKRSFVFGNISEAQWIAEVAHAYYNMTRPPIVLLSERRNAAKAAKGVVHPSDKT